MMDHCTECQGTGWRPVKRDGVQEVEQCPCRRKKPDAQPLSPKFESVGAIAENSPIVQAMLTPKEQDVAAIIGKRRGLDQAITISEIMGELAGDSPAHETVKTAWQRSIKFSVRRLRRAGMKIGASRGSHNGNKAVGYFVITTAAELAATVRPMLRQAVDELKTIERLTGKQMFARELEGQMRMFEGGR